MGPVISVANAKADGNVLPLPVKENARGCVVFSNFISVKERMCTKHAFRLSTSHDKLKSYKVASINPSEIIINVPIGWSDHYSAFLGSTRT